MKKLVKEYQDKSLKELTNEEKKLRDEITKTNLEKKVKQEKDTNILAKKKKRLAIVLTLQSVKKELEALKNSQDEVISSKKKNG